MLIYKKLLEIQGAITSISKDNRNSQQNYNFRGVDDVYNMVHPLFKKFGVITLPKVLKTTREQLPTKNGEGIRLYSVIEMEFTFAAEDGSTASVVTVGEGMDSGDKASNKAMSVAHKYAILQMFNIPTEDAKDPENDSHDLAPPETQKPFTRPAPATKPAPQSAPPSNQAPSVEALKDKVITVGFLNGTKFNDTDPYDLRKQYDYWLKRQEDGGTMSGTQKQFVKDAALWLMQYNPGEKPKAPARPKVGAANGQA